MIFQSVSKMDVITRSQHMALLLLVRSLTPEQMARWIATCVDTKIGRATAECVAKKLKEEADALVL
jgi:hypothetical protein